jgi:small subunit ribosomal protein S14
LQLLAGLDLGVKFYPQLRSLEKKVAASTQRRIIDRSSVIYMAKTSWIEREKKKAATVAKYADLRAELKAKGDYIGLSLLPRNASPVRMSKRCLQSGRKRAYIGRFKLSRIAFRELASHGLIPGVTKSSW